MAKLIGNSGGGVINPRRLLNSSDVFQRAVNKEGYHGLMLNSSNDIHFTNGGLLHLKMNHKQCFDIVGSLWADHLFSANFYNETVVDLAFSADKTYGCLLSQNKLRFVKLNTATGKYDELTQPANTLTGSYNCDMSDDGQHAAMLSASAPYIEFYHRVGDTWTKCAAAISGTMTTIGPDAYYTGRIFDGNNIAHVSNNGSLSITFQTLTYNSGTDGWEVATTSGLGTVGHSGLDYYYDGSTYYYVCSDISSPYVSFFKTTDSINFTDLSANITNKVNYQHYEPVWDPTGTYCFMNINDASHVFGVFKRDGDNLNYLGPTAFDELPPTASPTQRNTTTWSPDGKYVIIVAPSSYCTYMYERIGDNFYLVSKANYNVSASTPLDAVDRIFFQNNWSGFKFHWL